MKTVLIVDDNKQISDLYKSILDSSNLICYAANCGKDCLNILAENSIDLVLLDLAMPGMSGIEVLKILREDRILDKTKVIVITALDLSDGDSDDIKQRYGALAVLKKPINRNELLKIIVETDNYSLEQ